MVEFYQKKLESIEYLPSMPSVVSKLLEVLNDNSISNKEIAKIIALDSSISAKVLSMANSAIYGSTSQITDVNMAVVRLGRIDVKTIAMTLFVSNMLKKFKLKNISIDHYWKHNLAVAFLCRKISSNYKPISDISEEQKTTLYLSGLLHDIGYILFDQINPEFFQSVKEKAIETHESFIELEKIVMKTTHAHEGAELLKYWNLPNILCDTVRYHHEPVIPEDNNLKAYAEILNVADYFANSMDISNLSEIDSDIRSEIAWSNFDLAEMDTDSFEKFKNDLFSQTKLYISFSELSIIV
jgi:putative nucleotidyltransferase with HDIG domain